MKYIFIVNPKSGKGKGMVASKIIHEYCLSNNIDCEILYTSKVGEAKFLADLNKDLKDTIIYSVGGDGTLNEVINGLAHSKVPLGIVPVGSGNDFYKSIKENDNKVIDLGKVNNRYFINIASVGIDAEIAKSANEMKKYHIPSNLIYVTSIVKNIFEFNGIKLCVDDSKKYLTMLTICNGRFYGGGFKIAPNAEMDDKLLDIYEVNKLSKFNTLKLLSKLLKGTHESDNSVIIYKTNKIKVESDIDLVCNVDGEIIISNIFDFNVEEGAIRLDNTDKIKVNRLLKSKKIIK